MVDRYIVNGIVNKKSILKYKIYAMGMVTMASWQTRIEEFRPQLLITGGRRISIITTQAVAVLTYLVYPIAEDADYWY
jgi:hypothetical protein